jgi:hypothetical protein
MPTTRPRLVITETDPVARALDDAAVRWPADRASRAKLLMRLVEEGHRALLEERRQLVFARREAINRTSGALTESYGPGYLKKLREDWPG